LQTKQATLLLSLNATRNLAAQSIPSLGTPPVGYPHPRRDNNMSEELTLGLW